MDDHSDYGSNSVSTKVEPSAASIALMAEHLREVGNSALWRQFNDADFSRNFYKTIEAYIDDDMVPFFVVGSTHKSLERILVYTRDKKRVIDLAFSAIPIFRPSDQAE